jgi:predicted amidohydrolase
MPDTGVVVAVAQLALRAGERDANRQAASVAVAEAAAAGAQLVVLPELSDSGYVLSDASEARSLASPAASGVTAARVAFAGRLAPPDHCRRVL